MSIDEKFEGFEGGERRAESGGEREGGEKRWRWTVEW